MLYIHFLCQNKSKFLTCKQVFFGYFNYLCSAVGFDTGYVITRGIIVHAR